MKYSKRILAYSAFALIVLLAAVAAIAPAASSVAFAQTVPAAPDVTATSTGPTMIEVSWNAVSGADSYEVVAYDSIGNQRAVGTVDAPTITITDTGLVTGRAYRYWVRGINSGQGAWSAFADAIAGPAPGTPSTLTVTAAYLQNSLTWTAASDAVHYEVVGRISTEANNYRDLDLNASGTSFDHPGLTAGDTWYYWVRAVDSTGIKGLYAGPEIATVLAAPTVGAPSLTAALGDTQVVLSWTASTTIAGVTITGYEFRYRESGGTWGDWTADAGGDLTETVTGLTNGTAYDFEVRATTSLGTGASASRSQTPATVPSAPELTAEGIDTDEIRLTWTVPADDGGAAINRYHIEILNDQGTYAPVTRVPSSVTSWTHSGRTRATDYTYRVFAENVAGDGDWDSASARTLANPVQKPSPPTAVSATEGSGKVDLKWGEPSYNGGAPIIEYLYSHKETTGGTYRSFRSAGTDLKIPVTDLKPGTAYTFAVRARNSAGTSDNSESDSVTVAATAPTVAPGVTLNLGIVGGSPTPSQNPRITLSWNVVAAASNGGSPITGYEIEYKKSDAEKWTAWDGNAPGFVGPTLSDSGRSYSALHGDANTLLEPGTTYEYRVRAINDADGGTDDPGQSPTDEDANGNVLDATQVEENGPWSDVKSQKTKAVAPSTPALNPLLGAEAINGENPSPSLPAWTLNVDSITIRWTAPADGGSPITSYELWVTTNTESADRFGDSDNQDAVIRNLPGKDIAYTHSGLRTETTYYYRIRALNNADGFLPSGEAEAAGQISEVSPWSAIPVEGAPTSVAAPGTPGVPSAPTELANDAGTVTLTLNKPTSEGTLPITSYDVQYQRVDGDRVDDWSDASIDNPSPPSNPSYTQTGREGASMYQYRSRAINGNGAGGWSALIEITIAARAPDVPGDFSARSSGSDEIVLEWTVPENNGTDITGYEIVQWNPDPVNAAWRTTDLLEDDVDPVKAAEVTILTITGLPAGTEHFFRIRALGTSNSAWSAEDDNTDDAASATTGSGVPAMVTLMAAAGDDPGTIKLTWEPPTSGGSDITAYEIQVFDFTANTWDPEVTLPGTAKSYTDEDLKPGTRYYYTIIAQNSAGYGPWARPAVDELSGAGNPDAPDDLTATATSDTTIYLAWTAPNNNGTPITGYQLQRWSPAANGNTAAWDATNLLGAETVLVTQHTDTGRAAGMKYYYRVRARPQLGEDGNPDADEGWSATDRDDGASATTHGDVPSVPQTLEVSGTSTANTVTITWDPPANIGGSAVTSYKVQLWDSASSSWVPEADVTAPRAGTDPTYKDSGLAAGTEYHYRVSAVNSHGAGPYTTTYVTAKTATTGVDEPVLVATAVGPNEIWLTWNVPAANGNDHSGYMLEKWNGNDWMTLTNLLAGRPADTTLYIDTAGIDSEGAADPSMMAANTRYDYRIMAVGGIASGWAYADAKSHKDVPARPELMAEADGSDAIDLSWGAPHDNGSEIQTYTVEYWHRTNGWTILRTTVAQTRTATHANLDAGTVYVYRLTATNRVGTSKPSTLVSAKTEAAE